MESFDPLAETFLVDEGIMEIMSLEALPWIDIHHRSSFLPHPAVISTSFEESSSPFPPPTVTHEVWSEGNLGNITKTMSKPGVIEHIHIGVSCSLNEIKTYTRLFKEFYDVFAWSYKEMHGIDPNIVVHEIPTYPNEKPVHQWLHPVHPIKATAIKGEVEKLLKVGFIYPIPLTDWVSNIVLVNKKQGTIHVCVDYRDLNRACPKENYPTPFIDQIIDECVRSEIFSFMDGFSSYNQINFAPASQEKTAFIFPWGTFAYKKLPFGLKNVRATFQWEMSYVFHDIRNIVQPYLDDLPAHSRKRQYHPNHLRQIFLCCRHYNIWLNPQKCVFYVESG